MVKENLVVILDNGHGGMVGGKYDTPGKRSPNWEHGVLYEGAFNRWVVNRLKEKMDREAIPYYHITPEDWDIKLTQRSRRANEIYHYSKNVWLLSIHANAGGGRGIEVFTSPGDTKSDDIATMIIKGFSSIKDKWKMPLRVDYSDGDPDKEAKFHILTATLCPAVLIELGFMDNRYDYNVLFNKEYIEDVVDELYNIIVSIYVKGI